MREWSWSRAAVVKVDGPSLSNETFRPEAFLPSMTESELESESEVGECNQRLTFQFPPTNTGIVSIFEVVNNQGLAAIRVLCSIVSESRWCALS